ncbi:methyltransferase family protein [candidate division KSB1 bacterium]
MNNGIELNLYNIWLPFVIGYSAIWISMVYANRKRGKPIEDPEIYKLHNPKKMAAAGLIPTAAIFICSIFIPIQPGNLLWIGILIFTIGIIMSMAASFSFTGFTEGVNISGVYRFSRNPMYMGGFLFFLGLNLMGWTYSLINVIFVFLFVVWMGVTHWCVLKEESFLEYKYGDTYREYQGRVPRYAGLMKKKDN